MRDELCWWSWELGSLELIIDTSCVRGDFERGEPTVVLATVLVTVLLL